MPKTPAVRKSAKKASVRKSSSRSSLSAASSRDASPTKLDLGGSSSSLPSVGAHEHVCYLTEDFLKRVTGAQTSKELGEVKALTVNSTVHGRIRRLENLHLLPALEVLELPNHSIQRLDGLSAVNNLKTLDLSGNLVDRLDGLDQLRTVETLRLDRNGISSLPAKAFAPLVSLRTLSVANNELNVLRDLEALRKLKNLINLSVTGNPFCTLPHWKEWTIFTLDTLAVLNGDAITAEDRQQATSRYVSHEVDQYRERVAQADGELERLRHALGEKDAVIANLESANDDLTKKIADIENEKDQLREQMQAERDLAHRKSKELLDCTETLARIKQEIEFRRIDNLFDLDHFPNSPIGHLLSNRSIGSKRSDLSTVARSLLHSPMPSQRSLTSDAGSNSGDVNKGTHRQLVQIAKLLRRSTRTLLGQRGNSDEDLLEEDDSAGGGMLTMSIMEDSASQRDKTADGIGTPEEGTSVADLVDEIHDAVKDIIDHHTTEQDERDADVLDEESRAQVLERMRQMEDEFNELKLQAQEAASTAEQYRLQVEEKDEELKLMSSLLSAKDQRLKAERSLNTDMAMLNNRINSLTDDLQNKNKEVLSLQDRLADSESRFREAEKAVNEQRGSSDTEILRLRSEITSLEERLQARETQGVSSAELKNELNMRNAELGREQESRTRLEMELAEKQETVDSLKRSLETEKKRSEALDIELQETKAERMAIKAELQQRIESQENLQKRLEVLTNDLSMVSSTQVATEALSKEREELVRQLAEAEAQHISAQQKLSEAQRECEQRTNQAQELQKTLSLSQMNLEAVQAERNTLQQKLRQSQSDLDSMYTTTRSGQERHSSELKQLQSDVEQLRHQNEELNRENEEICEELERLRGLEEQYMESQKDVEKLAKSVAELASPQKKRVIDAAGETELMKQERETYKARISHLEKVRSESEHVISILRIACDDVKATCAQLKARLDVVEKEKSDVEAELRQSKDRTSALQTDLKTLQQTASDSDTVSSLRRELAASLEDARRWRLTAEELRRSDQQRESDHAYVESSNTAMESLRKELEREISKRAKAVEDLYATTKDLERERERLKSLENVDRDLQKERRKTRELEVDISSLRADLQRKQMQFDTQMERVEGEKHELDEKAEVGRRYAMEVRELKERCMSLESEVKRYEHRCMELMKKSLEDVGVSSDDEDDFDLTDHGGAGSDHKPLSAADHIRMQHSLQQFYASMKHKMEEEFSRRRQLEEQKIDRFKKELRAEFQKDKSELEDERRHLSQAQLSAKEAIFMEQKKREELEEEERVLRDDVQALLEHKEQLEQTISATEGKISLLQTEYGETQSRTIAGQERLKAVQKSVVEFESKHNTLRGQLSSVETELAEKRAELQHTLADVNIHRLAVSLRKVLVDRERELGGSKHHGETDESVLLSIRSSDLGVSVNIPVVTSDTSRRFDRGNVDAVLVSVNEWAKFSQSEQRMGSVLAEVETHIDEKRRQMRRIEELELTVQELERSKGGGARSVYSPEAKALWTYLDRFRSANGTSHFGVEEGEWYKLHVDFFRSECIRLRDQYELASDNFAEGQARLQKLYEAKTVQCDERIAFIENQLRESEGEYRNHQYLLKCVLAQLIEDFENGLERISRDNIDISQGVTVRFSLRHGTDLSSPTTLAAVKDILSDVQSRTDAYDQSLAELQTQQLKAMSVVDGARSVQALQSEVEFLSQQCEQNRSDASIFRSQCQQYETLIRNLISELEPAYEHIAYWTSFLRERCTAARNYSFSNGSHRGGLDVDDDLYERICETYQHACAALEKLRRVTILREPAVGLLQ